ncbi:MAG TPA: permease [Halanaerobiales bacterium]|nr:permease [Halanaerobiales bacterium]
MNITTILLLIGTIVALVISFYVDREKTIQSLKAARGRFMQTATQVIGILALIGLFLAVVPESLIKSVLGGNSVFLSTLYRAIVGTLTIIPAFIAFPLASSLVEGGAYLVATAAFITTLTMVGFATMPIEIEYFGKKFTYTRNLLSFGISIVIALGMGVIL